MRGATDKGNTDVRCGEKHTCDVFGPKPYAGIASSTPASEFHGSSVRTSAKDAFAPRVICPGCSKVRGTRNPSVVFRHVQFLLVFPGTVARHTGVSAFCGPLFLGQCCKTAAITVQHRGEKLVFFAPPLLRRRLVGAKSSCPSGVPLKKKDAIKSLDVGAVVRCGADLGDAVLGRLDAQNPPMLLINKQPKEPPPSPHGRTERTRFSSLVGINRKAKEKT